MVIHSKKNFIIVLSILIVSIQNVVALNLESYRVTIDAYGDGMAKVNNDLTLGSNNVKAISIKAFTPTSIIVTDGKEDLDFAVLNDSILIKLKQRNEVHLQYLTTALTSFFFLFFNSKIPFNNKPNLHKHNPYTSIDII